MINSPDKVLDEHFDQLMFWDTDLAINYAVAFQSHRSSVHGGDERDSDRYGIALAKTQSLIFETSAPIIVTADMCSLIAHAVDRLPDTIIRPDDVPAVLPGQKRRCGAVFFETPWETTDIRGDKHYSELITWYMPNPEDFKEGEVKSVVIALFTDVQTSSRAPHPHDPRLPRLTMVYHAPLPFGNLEDNLIDAATSYEENFPEEYERFKDNLPNQLEIQLYMGGVLLTTWQLLSETVPAVATRPARRRWMREKLDPPDISVVTLRRRDYGHRGDADPNPVDWTHRWIVDGHWRRIHKGTDQERLVWVHPYVKGPEGLPIVSKNKVYRLAR